jgi:hypothetical protein
MTYSVVEWLPLFITDATIRIVANSLAFCHREKFLRVNAYVIMPTHMHLIAFDADFDNERLIATLADFRKFTGGNSPIIAASIFHQALLRRSANRPLSIASAACGSPAGIRRRFTPSHSGGKSSTTSTTIRGGRGWCFRRTIGAGHRRGGTGPTARKRRRCL